MNQSVKLLKHLTDVNGIAGYEMQVKEAMRNYIEPVSDQIIEDNLGGIFGKKNAENGQYSIMISGHMDEVGFIYASWWMVESSHAISKSNDYNRFGQRN